MVFAIELPTYICVVVACTFAPTFALVVAKKVTVLICPVMLIAAAFINVALAVKVAPTVWDAAFIVPVVKKPATFAIEAALMLS